MRCLHNRDQPLTIVPVTVTSPANQILPRKDACRRQTGRWGECGSRGRICSPLPGGSGPKRPAGIMTGLRATSPAVLGGPGTGNAHPYLVPSQEARELELSGGVRSLPQVPLVERRQASAPDSGRGGASRIFRGAPCAPLAYRPWNTASAGVPLPFFYLVCSFVARMERSEIRERHSSSLSSFGWRAAPSGLQDTGRSTSLFDNTRARMCSRERGRIASAPARAGEGDHAQRGGGGL